MKITTTTSLRAAMLGAFALSLAACQADEPTTEVDAEDMSGGELITTPVDAEGVDVNLPETPMTPVMVEEADAEAAAE